MGSSVKKANTVKGVRCYHTQFLPSRIVLVLLAVLVEKNVLEMPQSGLVLWKVGSRSKGSSCSVYSVPSHMTQSAGENTVSFRVPLP